MGTLFSSATTA